MIIHNRREIDPDGQTPKSKPSPAVWIAPVAALSAVLVCIGIYIYCKLRPAIEEHFNRKRVAREQEQLGSTATEGDDKVP